MGLPVEAQPANVLHDGADVLDVFGLRVGVVEAQVADVRRTPGRCRSSGRVDLAWLDVEIAVGLRRRAGDDGLHLVRATSSAHDLAQKSPAGTRARVGDGGQFFMFWSRAASFR